MNKVDFIRGEMMAAMKARGPLYWITLPETC